MSPPAADLGRSLSGLLARLGRWSPDTLRTPVPSVGVEIAARGVSVVLVRRRRYRPRLVSCGTAPLARGSVAATLLKCSVTRPEDLVSALRAALREAGVRGGKAALALPDIAGRVNLLSVPEMPRSRRQAEELIRFRMKRSLPLRPDDVAVSFVRMPRPLALPEANGGAPDVVAVMAMRSVLEQHERALSGAGLRPGLVSLVTLELLNLARPELLRLAGSGGDAALLNCEPDYCTLAILRAGQLAFFRSKLHADGDEADAAARQRNLRRELSTSLSYYAEKLSGRLPLPLLVRDVDPLAEGLDEILADVGFSPAAPLELSGRVSLGPAAGRVVEGRPLERALAPALGVTAGRMS